MKLLAILAFSLALTGCDGVTNTSNGRQPEAIRVAEMQAAKAQGEAQTEMQKRLMAIQLDVIKRCADRGDIPMVTNGGNVDCKIVDKAAKK